jgi:aldehyde:ferredoxin oxidoreductase
MKQTNELQTTSLRKADGYIAVDTEKCIGCRTCEAVCAVYHHGKAGPGLSSIQVMKDWRKPGASIDVDFKVFTCRQCPRPKCLEACPEEAIFVDTDTGARVVDAEKCVGCELCVEACIFDPPRIRLNEESGTALKCDLCGGNPQCVQMCPSGALSFKKKPRPKVSQKLAGYAGQILWVDLGSGKISTVETAKYLPKYVGGRGIATRIYFEEVPPEVGAFDPDNKMIFMTGPLGGTLAPGAGRFCLVSKSPQTYPNESVADSNIGGDIGPALKFAGYDGMVVSGKAESPKYIRIKNDHVEICDAAELWGLGCFETQRALWQKYGPDTHLLTIGQAGEKLSRIAIILHQSGSAFGMGGFGGVMGSKNLKAIAIEGTQNVDIAQPEELIRLRNHFLDLVGRKHGETYTGLLGKKFKNVAGYFQHWYEDGGVYTGLHRFDEQGKAKMGVQACYGCPLGCRTSMKWADPEAMNLEDGSTQCFQAFGYWQHWYHHAEIDGIAWKWQSLVNDYGINCVELTAFYWLVNKGLEEGWLSSELTGWPLEQMGSEEFKDGVFKNSDFFFQHIHDVAHRVGFGDKISEGMGRLADYIAEREEFGPERHRAKFHYNILYPKTGGFGGYRSHFNAVNVGNGAMFYSILAYQALGQRDVETKHVDLGMYSPFGYIAPVKKHIETEGEQWYKMVPVLMKRLIGTDKPAIPPGFESAELATRLFWWLNIETDLLLTCDWLMDDLRSARFWSMYTEDGFGDIEIGLKFYNAITGANMTRDQLWESCERVFTLERAIAAREGRRRSDDDYNTDWYEYGKLVGPQPEGHPGGGVAGKSKGRVFDPKKLRIILDKFYKLVGWDAEGIPTADRLNELGLEDVAKDLKERGCF